MYYPVLKLIYCSIRIYTHLTINKMFAQYLGKYKNDFVDNELQNEWICYEL